MLPLPPIGRHNFSSRPFLPNDVGGGHFGDMLYNNVGMPPNYGGFAYGGGPDMFGPPMNAFGPMGMNPNMRPMDMMDRWSSGGTGYPYLGGSGSGQYMGNYNDYEAKFERFNRQIASGSSSSYSSRRRLDRSPRSRSRSYSSDGSGHSGRRGRGESGADKSRRPRDRERRSSSRYRRSSRSRSSAHNYHQKPSASRKRHRSRSRSISPKRYERR